MKNGSALLLLAPPTMALLILLAGSLFPVRLDCRTLQHLTKYEGLDDRLSGAPHIIYLSRDNGGPAEQMAAFTLRHLAFPDATRTWLILVENHEGTWWGEWTAVDVNGAFFSPGRPWPLLDPANIPDSLSRNGSRIVCDSRLVWSKFQARIPSLEGRQDVVFLEDLQDKGGRVLCSPRCELSPVRFLRLSLLFGAILSITLVAATRFADPLTGALAGCLLGVAGQIWLAFFSWEAWPTLLAAQWIGGGILLTHSRLPAFRVQAIPMAGVTTALAISLVVFVARLDFDGDVMTHWLPMARSFYHLGVHAPATLLAQGSMHAATYPPGYAIFLSMTMWAGAMDSARPFMLGPDTSLAILFYRLAIWLLNMAFLALLGVCLSRRTGENFSVWPVSLVLVAALIPTVRANHVAAETLLFPLFGSALVLQAMAPGRLVLLGCAIAGIVTLIKAEAALLVAATYFPWFLVRMITEKRMRSPKFIILALAVSIAAMGPSLIWRAGLDMQNTFFNAPSLHGFWGGRAEWASLLAFSVILVLKSPLWIPLFLLLPVGWVLGNARGLRWSGLIVPAATALLFLAFVSMYLFSNWMTKTLHIEQSLDRLLLIPAFSCILYFADSLLSIHRSTTEGTTEP